MASSSSSSSADLLAESSSSSEEEGFAFDGQIFATYQEMVEAKRARNRKVLEKSVGEISSALGSDFKGSKKSPLNINSSRNSSSKKRDSKKRKGRGSNQGGSRSVQTPTRRNPARAARSTTSSLSSQSHITTSFHSTKKKRRRIAPEEGSIMSTFCETDGNISDSAAGASVCSTSPSLPTSVNLKQNHIHNPSFFALNDTMSHAQKEVPAQVSATMPDQSLSPKSIMVKDMSASLEHILLNGGRVQARERIWRDFVLSDPILSGDGARGKTPFTNKKNNSKRKSDDFCEEETNRGRESDGLVHLSDWKLYHHITAHSYDPLYNDGKRNGDDNMAKKNTKGFFDEDDDIVIPNEFLAASESKSKPEAAANYCYQEQLEHSKMLQETLPLDNPVKYNNMVRERHTFYTSRGPDRHWDEEFGDGVDPMMFVEE